MLHLRHPGTPIEELRADLARRIAARDVRARKLFDRLTKAERARTRALLDLAASLDVILRDRLYVNLGHRTFRAFLESVGIGRSQAFKWIALARADLAGRVEELGVEGAYAALRKRRGGARPKAR